MDHEHNCDACSASGCTSRHTEEKVAEEIKAGPYLLLAAILIILASVLYRWLI
jgi:hypothetical protein